MRTVHLGINGLDVPAIGLGGMALTGTYGSVDDDAAVRTLRRAIDLGAGFLDTSDAYGSDGHNERLIGEAIAGRREDVIIATKFGYVGPDQGRKVAVNWRLNLYVDGSPAHVKASIDRSLTRLGVDVIDLWYLHFPDPELPIEETVGAMAEQVAAGKVRHLGLSNVTAHQLRKAAAVHPIAAVQHEYSLWTRDGERELIPACRELGVGLVAWGPLGSGFLTGTVTEVHRGDLRTRNQRFAPKTLDTNRDRFTPLFSLADEVACTPAQLALAWAIARGAVPIPSTRNIHHIEENLAAADLTLDADILDRIEETCPPGLAEVLHCCSRRLPLGSSPASP